MRAALWPTPSQPRQQTRTKIPYRHHQGPSRTPDGLVADNEQFVAHQSEQWERARWFSVPASCDRNSRPIRRTFVQHSRILKRRGLILPILPCVLCLAALLMLIGVFGLAAI